MAYEQVEDDKITSALQSNISEALSNISDPTSIEKRQMVYMREPDKSAEGFDGFPYIYLDDYSYTTEDVSMDGCVARCEGEFEIVIDAEDTDVEQKKYHDQLSDALTHVMKSAEKQNLEVNGLTSIDVESNNRNSTLDEDGREVLKREVVFSFRMMVTFDGS